MFKLAVILALAVVAFAHPPVHHHEEPANYDFKYEVHDHHTGDIKRQHESAHNGAIHGQYSLLDADGLRRVVKYTADDHNGFQAVVSREAYGGDSHHGGHYQQAHSHQHQPARVSYHQPSHAYQRQSLHGHGYH